MAGLTEFYCRSNETSHGSQFKWLDNTFKLGDVTPKKCCSSLIHVATIASQIVLKHHLYHHDRDLLQLFIKVSPRVILVILACKIKAKHFEKMC
jgi:hypothetical protein